MKKRVCIFMMIIYCFLLCACSNIKHVEEMEKWNCSVVCAEESNNDSYYIISYFEDIDGKEMDKREVLNTIIGRGMPSIAIFKDVVIIETEQEQGPAVKFLLQKV